MFKLNSFKEKNVESNCSGRLSIKGICKKRSIIFLVFLISLFWYLSVPAEASMVYGQVSGANFPANGEFDLYKGNTLIMHVQTNANREYSIFLNPSTYRVEFKDSHGKIWVATINGYSQPMRQDIHLVPQK